MSIDCTGERVEHAAFLVMWLSIFMLRASIFDVVNMGVFKISTMMVHSKGEDLTLVALAAEMKTHLFFE